MNLDLLFAIIFYGLIILLFVIFRKKFTIENKIFVMYKTKWGLKLMDKMARKMPRFWRVFGVIGIALGFFGMAAIMFMLVKGLITLILQPASPPTLGLVLPGVRIPGAPVFIPFWYGIISIFVVAVIHEFFHGVYSRVYDVNVKSSGVAFLGPILAAFVEPDEEQLKKKSKTAQLSVFAAGAYSNMLTAGILLLVILFAAVPISNAIVEVKGIQIVNIEEGKPLSFTGIKTGEIIQEVNNVKVNSVEEFTGVMQNIKPGENIAIRTNKTLYNVIATNHPTEQGRGYVGVIVGGVETKIRDDVKDKYGSFLPNAFIWFGRLLVWIFALSLGIGLVNLLPLGPIDGGRMFNLAALHFLKDENKTKRVFGYVSWLSLILVVLNLTFPYLRKLLTYLF